MKKRVTILSMLLILFPIVINAQESYPAGTPIGRIFADYRYSLNNEVDYAGFSVTRAWLGYKFLLDENFSAQVILDLGDPLTTATTSSKRYSYLRNALISYRKDKLTLTFGMTDTRASGVELKLWGKRYISRPFLLNYKYVNVADLGLIADYKISPVISVDAAILNGEGYTKTEGNNHLLYALGVTLTPAEGITLRAYGDTYGNGQTTQSTISTTTGYQNKLFSVAAGYYRKSNLDWTDGHNSDGYTTFGAVNITPKLEFFGRYDMVRSAVAEGETIPWNVSKDGSLIVTGLQYRFMRQLKVSLNYQGWRPDDGAVPSTDYIQLNAEFRF